MHCCLSLCLSASSDSVGLFLFFFFFKQKTAYEMRISDWSSDVCSSDLLSCDNLAGNGAVLRRLMREYLAARHPDLSEWFDATCTCPATMIDRIVPATTDADRAAVEPALGASDAGAVVTRSEQRRVGKECVSPRQYRWSPYH